MVRSIELGAASAEAATVVPGLIVEEEIELDTVVTAACITADDVEVGMTQTARAPEDTTEADVQVVDAKEVDESLGESIFASKKSNKNTTGEYCAISTQEV